MRVKYERVDAILGILGADNRGAHRYDECSDDSNKKLLGDRHWH